MRLNGSSRSVSSGDGFLAEDAEDAEDAEGAERRRTEQRGKRSNLGRVEELGLEAVGNSFVAVDQLEAVEVDEEA